MVFAVQANLAFRNAARRNTVSSNIQTRLAQNVPWGEVERVDGVNATGDPCVSFTVRFQTKAEQDAFIADLEAFVGTGINGPITGVSWYVPHDCPHDESNHGPCVLGTRRDWQVPSPDDIAGLWTRLKAHDIVGLSDNDAVTTWEDSSTNNKDGTGAGGPTWQTNELNGKAIVRFDGVDDRFTLPDASALTASTVFLVVKLVADPPTSGKTGLWDFGSAAGSGQSTHFPWTDGVIYDEWGTTARKSTVNPTPALTSWRLYEVISAASNWRSFLDGTSLFTTATNTVGFSTTPRLGSSFDASTTYWLDADVAEFIVYDSALPDDNDNARWVRQYVFDEYGVGVDYGLTDPGPVPSLFVVESGSRLA